MPKPKKNPVVAVVEYFKTADLAQAELALALAQEEVASRRPPGAPRKQRTPKKASEKPALGAQTSTPPHFN